MALVLINSYLLPNQTYSCNRSKHKNRKAWLTSLNCKFWGGGAMYPTDKDERGL